MKLYLIRHGQPEIDLYAGFPGPKLGLVGKQQAKQICSILQSKNINRLFASDYIRVIETLEPLLFAAPMMQHSSAIELREREKEHESHESLVFRVQSWFTNNIHALTCDNTAIFSHCGPINMILSYLDPERVLIKYPFEDQYKCLTPTGGLWELEFDGNTLTRGELIFDGKVQNISYLHDNG
jgi:broad specificity phosphatase PhoE